jgi:hypothetical protein
MLFHSTMRKVDSRIQTAMVLMTTELVNITLRTKLKIEGWRMVAMEEKSMVLSMRRHLRVTPQNMESEKIERQRSESQRILQSSRGLRYSDLGKMVLPDNCIGRRQFGSLSHILPLHCHYML